MNSSDSFYWHDYETTGADPALDRPVQFAGLRTDRDLNPLGEPLVLYCQPTLDCLPHPIATRITGISPLEALAQGVPEKQFIARILDELAQPGTCAVGYNSIRFDDEVTRYALYRNFFDPYERERGQGKSRWDLIDLTRAFYALRPAGISWPKGDDGKVSFRLELLSAANGIDHGKAHDALSDVHATIGLARRLRASQPALFDAVFASRSRKALQDLIDVQRLIPVLHISGMFGVDRFNAAVVVPLAFHPTFKNDVICADLSGRPDFLEMSVAEIQSLLFARAIDLPTGQARPPLKVIKLGRAPVLLPTAWAKDGVSERLGLDGDVLRRHLSAIRDAKAADPQGFTQHVQAVYSDRSFEPRTDPDTQLYDGFFSAGDRAMFAHVRAADGQTLRDQSWIFEDARLPELLFRYRARNFPDALTAVERQTWHEHCRQRLTTADGFTIKDFEAALSEELASTELTERQRSALEDLRVFAIDKARVLALSLSGQLAVDAA